jgi:hypothetical protein
LLGTKGYVVVVVVRETPLLFANFEAYHYNPLFPTRMPQNTYGDHLAPAAGVYKYVYFIAAPLPYH